MGFCPGVAVSEHSIATLTLSAHAVILNIHKRMTSVRQQEEALFEAARNLAGAPARQAFLDSNGSYLGALLYRYHDSFPRPASFPAWPQIPPANRRRHGSAS